MTTLALSVSEVSSLLTTLDNTDNRIWGSSFDPGMPLGLKTQVTTGLPNLLCKETLSFLKNFVIYDLKRNNCSRALLLNKSSCFSVLPLGMTKFMTINAMCLDKMATWWNLKLNCQVDKMSYNKTASRWNIKWTKWQVDEIASRRNEKSTKWHSTLFRIH